MSHRPIRVKAANRLRKQLYRQPIDANIDLVQWLKDRHHASTTAEAEKIILAGRVKHESHVIGRATGMVTLPLTALQQVAGRAATVEERDYVVRYVPAELRSKLTVLPA